MGFFNELKDKAEEFGDKAQEGFAATKDKAGDVIDDVKDRLDGDDNTAADMPASSTADDVAAAEEAGQDVAEFAPVGATEPAVAAVEEATADAQESAQGTGEALDATEPSASSADEASQEDHPIT